MSRSEPISKRQASAAIRGSALRHPAPDLHLMDGVYARNIEKLESTAEELSASGSDLGEAILKMSRQNSIQSSQNGDIAVVRPSVLERMGSTHSSRAPSSRRSNVDANGSARWGGYSPNGVVTSPVGSVSGSWSQASLSRVASASRSSRLAHVNEPLQEGRPLDSPTLPNLDGEGHTRELSQSSFAQRYDEIAGQIEESLQHVPSSESQPKRSVSIYSNEAIVEEAEGSVTPERPRSTDTFREAQLAFKDFDGVHFDPDTDEFIELDEAGNELRRVSARSSSGGMSFEAATLLRSSGGQRLSQGASQVVPPGKEGMTYYPAPVPKVLNMPKRMSQQPAATVQSKRRSQMLSDMSPEARAAAPWLNQERVDGEGARMSVHHNRGSGSAGGQPRGMLNQRMSAHMANLPPHARASMYFDPPPVQHDIELKSGSAVATLDSILDASATAPATAFTDHPYVGDVRKSVYSLERQPRQSTGAVSSHSSPKDEKKTKRRSSSFGVLFKGRSSTDELDAALEKTGSRGSIVMDPDSNVRKPNKLKKRRSQMSFGDELDERPQSSGTLGSNLPGSNRQSGLIASAQNATPPEEQLEGPQPVADASRMEGGEQIENDFKQEEAEEDVEEEEELSFVKPATLLAELQVRKAQQKSRGKTAATAFPKGMHSTLLQMDAVEEIAKKKRKQARIELAWEDPQQRSMEKESDGEDDVPLGMLFPSKAGQANRPVGDGKDMDRPLGLIEKRHLEDHEPLSSRRNRLKGVPPSRGNAPGSLPNGSQLHLAIPPDAAEGGEAGDENETLGQRMKRMREKAEAGNSKAEPKEGEGVSSGFAEDVLGQFASLGVQDKDGDTQKPAGSPALPAEEEEETLGQRRARLQREREASGEQQAQPGAASRPPLQTANSFASLLSSNPVGQRQAIKNYQPGQGTLLGHNARVEAMQKSQLLNTNQRASSYHMDRPLVDSRAQYQSQNNPGSLLASEQARAMQGGFAAGMYNNGMGGIQMPMSAGAPPMGMTAANSYFASPTAASPAGYGYGYPQMQTPMQPVFQQQYTNPLAYAALTGGAMMSPPMMGSAYGGNAYNPGMMGGTYASYAQNMGGMGFGVDEPMTNSQRSAIDRWRASIHQ